MPVKNKRKPNNKLLKAELLKRVEKLEEKVPSLRKEEELEEIDFYEYMKRLYIDGDKSIAYKDIIVSKAVLNDVEIYNSSLVLAKIRDKEDRLKDLEIEQIADFIFTCYCCGEEIHIMKDYFNIHTKPLVGKSSSLIVHSAKRGSFDKILDKISFSPLKNEGFYHHFLGYVVKQDEVYGMGKNKTSVKKGDRYFFERKGKIDLIKKFC